MTLDEVKYILGGIGLREDWVSIFYLEKKGISRGTPNIKVFAFDLGYDYPIPDVVERIYLTFERTSDESPWKVTNIETVFE